MAERWRPGTGERIRVRTGLVGTCREERPQPPPDATITRLRPVAGHRSKEEGKAGTVVRVEADAEGPHSVLVQFDEPVTIGPVPGWVQRPDRMYYAPSEREPATD
jgi:hypothetical protein